MEYRETLMTALSYILKWRVFVDLVIFLLKLIDLIHDSRHIGFAIIMQISDTLLTGQTTQFWEVITNILATQMICFTFIE